MEISDGRNSLELGVANVDLVPSFKLCRAEGGHLSPQVSHVPLLKNAESAVELDWS